jgi:hypothetical protein
MRPVSFDPQSLRKHLLRHKIATLPELKQALGATANLTVFRKLKRLDYLSSYTHRGRYYSLREIARFDDAGLWSHDAVWFSRYGTLVSTIESFVNQAPGGWSADELADALHAEVQDPLHDLVLRGRLRRPDEATGRIFSITEKRFPEVVGDGQSTLRNLVLRDRRAARIAGVYLQRDPDRIPAAGEHVLLVEIGSHSRGAIFLDGSRYETAALRAAIDAVAQCHPGFYFGRFDLRTASLADFQAGRFSILELNGVSAEATHIYDPAVSVWKAYRTIFRQWGLAFEIGAANRSAGARPLTIIEFAGIVRRTSTHPRAAGLPARSLAETQLRVLSDRRACAGPAR